MTSLVYCDGKSYDLSNAKMLGEGGEAIVYIVQVNGVPTAFKIWRQPDDAYYKDIPDPEQRRRDQEGARERLLLMSEKLMRYPRAWSERVVLPVSPVTNRSGKQILGYSMPIVENVRVLRDLAKRKTRPPGYDPNMGMQVFRDLHPTVSVTHKAGVVIGDFNYFNVLVRTTDWTAHLIDADSMQFGAYFCKTFTTRFVDPRICDASLSSLVQAQPHTQDTDWYAYAAMLFETMMLVPIYGGIYEPAKGKPMVELDTRPLRRISVLHPDVTYPSAAIPLKTLPDDVLHYYSELVTKDARGPFPRPLIDNLRWTTCTGCGAEHARSRCPNCAQAAPAAAVKETIRGKVRVMRVFDTGGIIVRAGVFGGAMHVLFHRDGAFHRTSARYSPQLKSFVTNPAEKLIDGEISPEMRFNLQPSRTLIGLGSTVFVIDGNTPPAPISVDTYQGNRPMFTANADHYYFASNGELLRNEGDGTRHIGRTLQGETRFCVGPKFGFGFYRVGNVLISFVFDAKQSGINDSVQLPSFRGQLLDASCSFDDHRCWLFTVTRDGSKVTNSVYVISRDGTVTASNQVDEGHPSWLGNLGGRVAVTLPKKGGGAVHALFAGTDSGIVRIHEDNGSIIEGAQFPDTKGFVDGRHELLLGSDGIFTVDRRLIQCVQLLP